MEGGGSEEAGRLSYAGALPASALCTPWRDWRQRRQEVGSQLLETPVSSLGLTFPQVGVQSVCPPHFTGREEVQGDDGRDPLSLGYKLSGIPTDFPARH